MGLITRLREYFKKKKQEKEARLRAITEAVRKADEAEMEAMWSRRSRVPTYAKSEPQREEGYNGYPQSTNPSSHSIISNPVYDRNFYNDEPPTSTHHNHHSSHSTNGWNDHDSSHNSHSSHSDSHSYSDSTSHDSGGYDSGSCDSGGGGDCGGDGGGGGD